MLTSLFNVLTNRKYNGMCIIEENIMKFKNCYDKILTYVAQEAPSVFKCINIVFYIVNMKRNKIYFIHS